MKNREILTRQFRIVLELHRRPGGQSSESLARSLGASRATIDRDLRMLRDNVGLPIERQRKTGEVWHTLRELPIASIAATPLQIAALRLAREALGPLAGTALVGHLDGLLAHLPAGKGAVSGIDRVGKVPAKPQRSMASVVQTIDTAMQTGKRLRVVVRVASRDGQEGHYTLDPLVLRVVDEELYLFAWAHERRAARTFKVVRVQEARILEEPALPHPELRPEEAFRGAVKAWSGEMQRVRVRILREKAWLAGEYPLVPSQRLEPEPDGSVVVEAEVAGLREAVRWVLSWGRHAEALAPASLRSAVAEELGETFAHYRAAESEEVRSKKVSEPGERGASLKARARARSMGRARGGAEATER